VDASGNLYIADTYNNRIREVAAGTGIITTVAGNGTQSYSGDGGAATSAELNYPYGVAVDASGNLYIADCYNSRIRKVAAGTGIITTVAGNGTAAYSGDGGAATSAKLYFPCGVALDASGNLYIVDTSNNRIRMVSAVSPPLNETIISFPTTAVGSSAVVQNVLIETTEAETISSITVPASLGGSQEFTVGSITGCTIGASNASGTTCTVPITFTPAYPGLRQLPLQVVTSQGIVNIGLEGTGTGPQAALTPGIITTVAGNGTQGYSGDGGAAISSELDEPDGVAVDASGNLYIADLANNRIRKVAVGTGIISTVAGNGTAGYSGDGGAATSAELNYPYGVAVDASGNLYIADTFSSRIRMVSAATGIITTVAGNGTRGYSGDGGAATSSELDELTGVAVDASGNLYIADGGTDKIRKVAAATGIVTTVAGNGPRGYSGDGGAATSAELDVPYGVAVDASGNLYISDEGSNRIRKVNVATTPALTFATTPVGVQSADSPKSFTLSNTGTSAMTILVPSSRTNPSISTGFSYDASSTCPQLSVSSSAYSLNAGSNCTYSVDFIPASAGSYSGSLVLNDNSLNNSGSSQSVSLSGTATQSSQTITFMVSGTAVTVLPGATTGNTSTITVTPSGGFTGSVVMTAAVTSTPTGAQDLPTLSFGSTSPVSITGTTAGTATLTISTTAATSAVLVYPKHNGVPWYTTGGATLTCILLFSIPVRRRRWQTMLGMLALLVALSGGLLACGGANGGGGGSTTNPGTTPGAYTVTITGTSGSTTTTGAVTLNVQ
jgi:sugar lactone lactonase YvrE